MDEWLTMTAADLGRGIGAGRIDPVALCEAYLGAAEAHPFRDRIYARMTRDRAMAEARAAAKRAADGQRLSPLDGVPVSWKDLFDSAGVATEAGSALLAGRVPERDAEVLRVATSMGLVCLGKTHLSELAFSGLGLNPVTATSPCVNDHDAVSGGSSSGAAASVAFGLAAAGIGSDTGGSVRVPAAWNDLVGLKTTSGRVSLAGVVPLCARFDTVGPLARSVEDAALLLAALEGTRPVQLAPPRPLRLGMLQTCALEDLAPEVASAFESACKRLSKAGHRLVDVDAPMLPAAMDLSPVLFATEAYGTWKDVIEAAPEKMFPAILERFRGGASVTGPDFVAGWQALDRARADWAEAMAGFDAVLVPSTPNLPPNVARLMKDDDYYKTANLLTLRNTRIGNLMGLAALTLPTGVPSCGLMAMGRAFGEEALLQVGAGIEAALGV
ncbi:amidase [Mesobacterium pallidum]|uniref:amidase n=1 Tax=Mesobacterium pallidum TaxID=2872037 RepID=UPI001EE16883|nr:amidase family protein [Mesobacterium pallidum]